MAAIHNTTPFHSPSMSFTLTQPLLRGRGPGVNLRFIHVAQLNQKVSRLLFEQQLLETVYGISRLYYDLVSLGENIGVKQESLAAAQKLYNDDKDQVDLGTLPPIELTRAQALLSSSRLDFIQAQSEYRQQESLLKEQLLRHMGDPGTGILTIVPTDRIVVPDSPPAIDVNTITADALSNRPDLVQASLQVKADEISLKGSRNRCTTGTEPLRQCADARFLSRSSTDHWYNRHRHGDRPSSSHARGPSPLHHLSRRSPAQSTAAQSHRAGRRCPRCDSASPGTEPHH